MITVLRRSWALILSVALIGGFGALIWCWWQEPEYEATTNLLVSSGSPEGATAPYENAMGSERRAASYAKLVYSDTVLAPALEASGVDMTLEDAKSVVSAAVIPETALLTVGAESTDPRTAEKLANALSDSIVKEVGDLERPPGSANPTSRLSKLSPAIIDPKPVYPVTITIVVLSVIIGAVLGVIIALVWELCNRRVRDAHDVLAIAGVAPIAVIPEDKTVADSRVVSFRGRPSDAANAFRSMRNRVLSRSADEGVRVIAVTGCHGEVGTTTVTENLAAVLIEARKSVIVVDADFVNSDLSRRAAGAERLTLFDFARRRQLQATFESRSGELGQPKVIGLGFRDDASSGDVLSSNAVGEAIGILRQEYDYVLLDTASLVDSPNTTAVFQWVDGVVLVTDTSASTATDLSSCVNRLPEFDVELVGVVLNKRGRQTKRSGHGRVKETTSPETRTPPDDDTRTDPAEESMYETTRTVSIRK